MRLRQPEFVLFVFGIGSAQQQPSVAQDFFLGHQRPPMAARFLTERKVIHPFRRCALCLIREFDLNDDIRMTARCQASDLGQSASVLHSVLQTAMLHNIPKEAEDIQEVRLAAGIGTNQKGAICQRDVAEAKIPPILQFESSGSYTFSGNPLTDLHKSCSECIGCRSKMATRRGTCRVRCNSDLHLHSPPKVPRQ